MKGKLVVLPASGILKTLVGSESHRDNEPDIIGQVVHFRFR
jgi:hypothetical protein